MKGKGEKMSETRISDTPIIDQLCTRASQIPDTNPDNWLLLNAAEITRDLLKTLNTIATVPLPGEPKALRLTGSDAQGMIRMARAALAKATKGA
jgi:hypothetical protein